MDTTLWQYVISGDLLGLVVAVYISRMRGIFYGVVLLLMSVPIYIRTQSLTYCLILWVLCSGLLFYFMPIVSQSIIGLFAVLTLGGLIFMLFSRLRR